MGDRLRILIVNRALGTVFGGGESFDFNAARFLARRGHKVTVITAKPLLRRPLEYPDVDVVYVPSPNFRNYAYLCEHISTKLSAAIWHADNWLFEKQVFHWLSRGAKYKQFDILQCCGLFRLSSWTSLQFQKPVVVWLPGPPSGLDRIAIKKLVRNANFGLFTHGAPVEVLQEMGLVLNKDFFIVEPGIELSIVNKARLGDKVTLKRQLGIPETNLVGITVCRLVPIKNVDLLIRGIAKAVEKGANYHWLIVGDGPERQRLEKLTHKVGLDSRVHFLGYQPNHKVHQLLAISDVYALTSTYESFSIATLEAMAHRLPVVATKVGYLQVMVKESGAGLLVSPNDTDALADALVKLTDEGLRRQLGNQGRTYAERFDWPAIAEKLEKVFENVMFKSNQREKDERAKRAFKR